MSVNFVVIGGGIAGVSCAETLSLLCSTEDVRITLVTASPLVKAVTNFKQVTKAIEEFDVEEKSVSAYQSENKRVTVIQKTVTSLDALEQKLFLLDGESVNFTKLCICTGGSPKIIARDNPYVIGIRDTESVKTFQKKLAGARRVVIVGNGGIATELAYEIEGCDVVWAIKHDAINNTFVDAGAAEFFLPHLKGEKTVQEGPLKRLKYTVTEDGSNSTGVKPQGGALGPDWTDGLEISSSCGHSRSVHVEYNCEVQDILTPDEFKAKGLQSKQTAHHAGDTNWPVYVCFTNNHVYGCDLVVSATGVLPNTSLIKSGAFDCTEEGFLKVDSHMATSVKDIYAAGDVCNASWELAENWFQMRLWTQARQMGMFAAQCMVADHKKSPISLDFCFELFAHQTKFFGYKVILLGRYNGQGLGKNYEVLLRVTKGHEYIKVVLHDGKMVGAILIGETDLEETFENLILNRLDLTRYGEDLLDPNIDLEDYFD